MGVIGRRPKLTVLRCTAPGCGQLHLDRSEECALECDAEMEEVEVIAADTARGAVDALRSIEDVLRDGGTRDTIAEIVRQYFEPSTTRGQ